MSFKKSEAIMIEWATAADEAFIAEWDHHILASLIGRKIENREYDVFRNDLGDRIGWMSGCLPSFQPVISSLIGQLTPRLSPAN